MKKLFCAAVVVGGIMAAGSAGAADLAVPYKAPPPPPVYNWSGFYLGAHVGGGWGENRVTDNNLIGFILGIPSSSQFSTSGWLAGGQAGYNYQIGRLVIGPEVDFSWANINGTENDTLRILGVGPIIGNRVLTDRTD